MRRCRADRDRERGTTEIKTALPSAPAESYLDTGNRPLFENGDGALLPHPDMAAETDAGRWQRNACRPLTVAPDLVEPIWRALAARAGVHRKPPVAAPVTNDDVGLQLVVGSQILAPVESAERRHVFALPPRALGRAWWTLERAGTALWRWTDGDAALRLPARTRMLEVTLRPAADDAPATLRPPAAASAWRRAA